MRIACALALVLAACTDSGLPTDGDGGLPPPDLAGADLAPDPTTRTSLTIGPIPLNPAQERTVCSRFRLGAAGAIDVVRIAARLQPGSHHLILYKSTATTERRDLYDCQPLDISKGDVPLFIAETEDNNTLPLPPGVAFHLAADQMVRIEAHYINATPKPITGQGTIDLFVGPPATYQPADIMFCGSVAPLYATGVPPGKSTLPAAFYRPPDGIKVFGLTTHQHKRGTLMTVDRSTSSAPGENLTMGQPYDNPPFRIWTDPNLLTFGPGEGFRWQCSYDNPTSKTYYFGQSAEDNEMCFLWAYYYPSVGHFITQECLR